jgi:benzoyl-CoA reductase/2-hydroxyglutaryl-CoA dehydratase subunit BcrC/BadD/HgdB
MASKTNGSRVIPYNMLSECVSSTYELVQRIVPEPEMHVLRTGLKYLERTLIDCIQKADEGLPIIGHHFAFPAEYLYAFDCVPICIEATSYLLAALLPDGSEKYYDLITHWGHPYHTCSSQKGVMGMVLDDLFQFDVITTPTAPCDNTYASYPFFAYEGIPLVVTDMPFLQEEKSYEYFAEQIELGLDEIGKIIGQEPDYEKLKKFLEIENETLKIELELYEMRKGVPCPVESMMSPMSAAAQVFMAGRQEKLDYYNEIYEAVKKNYKNKESPIEEERIRSVWPYMVVFFDLALCEWVDRELGMSILLDIFTYNFYNEIDTSSKDKMLYGMSKKAMNFPMIKQSVEFYEDFIPYFVEMTREYQADCAIFTSHLGCKQFGSIPQILREALRDELGIPMLIIDIDVGDKRFASMKTVKDKIRMFTNTLL